MMLSLIFLSVFFICISTEYLLARDLERLRERYACESKCTFNHSEINSETIKEWPNCYDICGILTFNANSNVPISQLKSIFSQTRQLFGGIRIENTPFKDLSFLSFPLVPFSFYCDIFGTSISNNSKLENIDELYNVDQLLSGYQFTECPFRLSNNPKLDASSLCESAYYKTIVGLEVDRNKKDCGCHGGVNSQQSLRSFQNCTSMYGGLSLINLTDSLDAYSLSKVTKVKGLVEIQSSDFHNLAFLKNLKTIQGKSTLRFQESFLNIHDNPNLIRLGWDSLTVAKLLFLKINYWFQKVKNYEFGLLFMNIQNLHADFCLTFDEIIMLMKISVRFKHLHASICNDYIPLRNDTKVCIFDSMSSLDSDCTWIHGDLLIDSGDELFVGKLENVTRLFGSLTVRNTHLENVRFLKKLQSVALLRDSPVVIRVSSNRQLSNFSLPKLAPILTRNLTSRIVFEDNFPNLFRSSRWCLFFQMQVRKNVSYNGGNCLSINEKRENKPVDGEVIPPSSSFASKMPALVAIVFTWSRVNICR